MCTGITVAGLLWANKSVPRLFLFKQITSNTVRRAGALALEVHALKANNGHTHTQVIVTHGVIRVIVASRLLILFYSVCRVDFLVSLFENVMIMFHWCQCSFSVFALMQRVFMRIMILRSSQ